MSGLPPRAYSSLGDILHAAMDRWAGETCLIEADRDRENCRLTYRQFAAAARPIARWLQDEGVGAGDRAAIIMSNQSKWLVAAYAVFFRGGVLAPLDYKLTAGEHLGLLAHSGASLLFVEYPLWRSMLGAEAFNRFSVRRVVVTEAPAGADLHGAARWEELQAAGEPDLVARCRQDPACIVYSSGTAGRPKGCVLTHGNYLEQLAALLTLFPLCPGVRYLSILPTNHAIDFMAGFVGPFVCGACVVHLRTLRPELVREAFSRYRITHVTVVPAVLQNLATALRKHLADLPLGRRAFFDALVRLNRWLTRRRPNVCVSRRLLPQVHAAFGGCLEVVFVGGAFSEPAMLRFFYDLGIPVVNGYGLTEAGTVLTLNDLRPFRADTVGRPLPGVELRIAEADAEGAGDVAARGPTVMSHYLDDPELTAETIVDGWLMTGDLGRLDEQGHLHLLGRKKNMVVTAGGKNVYPEDVEAVFDGLPVRELCVFASNYIWPRDAGHSAMLLVVLHPIGEDAPFASLVERNRMLPEYKRLGGYILWQREFPRTASQKIRRAELAEELRASLDSGAIQRF